MRCFSRLPLLLHAVLKQPQQSASSALSEQMMQHQLAQSSSRQSMNDRVDGVQGNYSWVMLMPGMPL
jgi:hypothetical protein